MSYWKGMMHWPVVNDWKCQTCEAEVWYLEWGLQNGLCRCSQCHTNYFMRTEDGQPVTTPICLLKSEYVEPAKKAWRELSIPVNEVTDSQWIELGVPEQKE